VNRRTCGGLTRFFILHENTAPFPSLRLCRNAGLKRR
jgi:hypothetical protein